MQDRDELAGDSIVAPEARILREKNKLPLDKSLVGILVTDLDGNALADRPVEITAGRLDWKFRKGEWKEEVVDVQTCKLTGRTRFSIGERVGE